MLAEAEEDDVGDAGDAELTSVAAEVDVVHGERIVVGVAALLLVEEPSRFELVQYL